MTVSIHDWSPLFINIISFLSYKATRVGFSKNLFPHPSLRPHSLHSQSHRIRIANTIHALLHSVGHVLCVVTCWHSFFVKWEPVVKTFSSLYSLQALVLLIILVTWNNFMIFTPYFLFRLFNLIYMRSAWVFNQYLRPYSIYPIGKNILTSI